MKTFKGCLNCKQETDDDVVVGHEWADGCWPGGCQQQHQQEADVAALQKVLKIKHRFFSYQNIKSMHFTSFVF